MPRLGRRVARPNRHAIVPSRSVNHSFATSSYDLPDAALPRNGARNIPRSV